MGENSTISSIVAGGRVGAVGGAAQSLMRLAIRRFGGAFKQSVHRGVRCVKGVVGLKPFPWKGSVDSPGTQFPKKYPWS